MPKKYADYLTCIVLAVVAGVAGERLAPPYDLIATVLAAAFVLRGLIRFVACYREKTAGAEADVANAPGPELDTLGTRS